MTVISKSKVWVSVSAETEKLVSVDP